MRNSQVFMGTTGPKICDLTHKNLIVVVDTVTSFYMYNVNLSQRNHTSKGCVGDGYHNNMKEKLTKTVLTGQPFDLFKILK